MATSGSYSVTVTALDLIENAYLNIGAHALGETLSSEKSKLGREGLNNIIKLLEGPPNYILPAEKMWQRETGLLTLDSTKNSYSLKASGGDLAIQIPLEILTAVIRNTAQSTDVTLDPMTLEEYQALSNKAAAGTPLRYYYEKRTDEGVLYLDCKPSVSVAAAYKISFVYRQPLEIISSNPNEIDIEPSYRIALELGLSRWLAPKMGRQIGSDINTLYTEAVSLSQTFQPDNINVYYEKDRD